MALGNSLFRGKLFDAPLSNNSYKSLFGKSFLVLSAIWCAPSADDIHNFRLNK